MTSQPRSPRPSVEAVEALRTSARHVLSRIYIFGLPDTQEGRAVLAGELNELHRAVENCVDFLTSAEPQAHRRQGEKDGS